MKTTVILSKRVYLKEPNKWMHKYTVKAAATDEVPEHDVTVYRSKRNAAYAAGSVMPQDENLVEDVMQMLGVFGASPVYTETLWYLQIVDMIEEVYAHYDSVIASLKALEAHTGQEHGIDTIFEGGLGVVLRERLEDMKVYYHDKVKTPRGAV